MAPRKYIRITLRLEEAAHRAIVKIVRRNDSSLNTEINNAAKQYVAKGRK